MSTHDDDTSHSQIDPNLLDTGGYSLEASLVGFDYGEHLETPIETPEVGTGGGNKRKNGGKDGESPAPKRTRQSQSCDACRARKVKCDRPPPGSAAAAASGKDVCSHCEQLNLPCTFDYKPKKRGPPNLYLRKMQSGEFDESSQDSSPRNAREPKPYGYNPSPSQPTYDRRQSGMSAGGTLASLNSMQASALANQGESIGSNMGRHVDDAWDEALAKSVAAHAALDIGPSSTFSGGHLPQTTGAVPQGLLSSPSSFASPPYAGLPHNPSNPIEAIIPRGLLYHIVDLFFDYVYPLTPCLHKPTLMRDLHEKREERSGQEEFTHMIYSLVSSTLSQVPRSFVAMPRREVKGLIDRCYGLCRGFMSRDYSVLSIDRMVMMYFTTLTSSIMGGTLRGFVTSMIFGAHCSSITTLGLCDERTYQTLDPISRELHRRIFWLAYGADRSSSSIEGTPLTFNEVDAGDVALPAELDDEYITEDTYLTQPTDKVPILSGFCYISQLWRYTGQLMEKRRQDRRSPPHGILLQIRLNELEELHDRVMGLMDDCPEVLKLDFDASGKTPNMSPGWDAHASADIRSLFLDPKSSKAAAKDAYLVQQANIYVSQQVTRLMIIQYRDELQALQAEELSKSASPLRDSRDRRYSATRKSGKESVSEEEKEQVMADLLIILQRIPIQVIAVNTLPLVSKVRMIASTLLDSIDDNGMPIAPEGRGSTDRKQRAQTYLWDFLKILSEIESMYSFTENDTQSGAA